MATYQQYFGRFYLDDSLENFSLGAAAITLTNAYYFISGYTSESTAQLCEHIQAAIRAEGTYASATCSYSASTGKITIATGGAAAAITWTDSALQTLLGFTGTQSSATSHTATNQPRYVWRPTREASNYSVDLSKWFSPRSLTRTLRSKSGTTYSIVGNKLWESKVAYAMLPVADVITTSSTVWESFQQFWEDVFANGEQIRCYPDRTLNASTNVFTAVPATKGDDMGSFNEFATRHIRTYQGLWNLNFDLWKYV